MNKASTPIGIIGAMDSEIEVLVKKLTIKQQKVISNNRYYLGNLENKDVIIVRAGIGKVNAAITAQILVSVFNISSIIFTGIAGGVSHQLKPLDMVIATSVIHHDYDTTALGDQLGHVPGSDNGYFYSDSLLVSKALKICEQCLPQSSTAYAGVVASGDQFVVDKDINTKLIDKFNAMAVEMEGAAVGQVATLANVPFVIIRAISDTADENAAKNFKYFATKAAQQSATVVIKLLNMI